MKIGYIRVSTQEQNTIRQEDLMERLGVEHVYMDKMSGKVRDRPAHFIGKCGKGGSECLGSC